jgi:antitoxin (DNA-binding transcriptional repressor) of toxin-antitoxin stability system
VTITKHGKPFVRIEPVANGKQSVWTAREKFVRHGGKLPAEIEMGSNVE